MLHVQMVRNLLDCRLDPQQALDAPRWYLHGTGATQSEADMRHSSVLLEDGYGGRWDGNQQTGSGGDEISERSAAGGEEEGAVKDGVNSGPVCATSARQDENAVAQGLAQRGHRVLGVVRGRDRTMFGWGHVILRDPVSGVLWAGSEPRCDGCAVPAVL
jgi:gamma-glutamyltranspeptidase